MRAIVTGAASGIGLAAAHRLHQDSLGRDQQPARLVLADRDGDHLATAAAKLEEAGAEIVTCVADLTNPEACAETVAAAGKAFDGLDGLVSNAGIVLFSSLLDLTLEDYERTFAINTRATWLLAKAAHPLLKKSHGALVATASVAAYEPTIALGAYSASKAALLMIVRQLACDWGRDGIRCNSVSPGTTRTNITGRERSGDSEPGQPANNPLGFASEAEDQAAAIAFLLSPDARFINGADIVVDGGARTQLMLMSGMARTNR